MLWGVRPPDHHRAATRIRPCGRRERHAVLRRRPRWWDLKTGDFDSVAAGLPEHSFDRIVLDMLDPWNRLEQAYRVIAPGGVLIAYITTTTQMSRLVEALREAGHWTDPAIQETLERTWKAQGLAVRPDHAMIGHTGFLVVSRAMAEGFAALRKRDRATKDTTTDIDSLTPEQREAPAGRSGAARHFGPQAAQGAARPRPADVPTVAGRPGLQARRGDGDLTAQSGAANLNGRQ